LVIYDKLVPQVRLRLANLGPRARRYLEVRAPRLARPHRRMPKVT